MESGQLDDSVDIAANPQALLDEAKQVSLGLPQPSCSKTLEQSMKVGLKKLYESLIKL